MGHSFRRSSILGICKWWFENLEEHQRPRWIWWITDV